MEVLGTVGTVAAFIGILVVLVLVHELGHYLVAKRAGITVEEFGIGFPPRIGSVTWHGTRYSLNWIPLGGFVRMLGEDGNVEVKRLRKQGLNDAEIERAMEGAFNRRPVWIRVAVLLAGVAMNFLLAAALFGIAYGMPRVIAHGPLTVTGVQEDSPADGRLQEGDVIVGADGRRFELSAELTRYIAGRGGEPVTLDVERDGEAIAISVVPRTPEELTSGSGPVGFRFEAERLVEEPPLARDALEAARLGTVEAAAVAVQIPGGLADAVGGLLGLNPDAAGDARGPIGIAQETGRILEAPFRTQLFFVGLLSVNLAVLNVLPFPPLDGGRIAVVLVEALRRRKLPAEREALIYLAGFAVLIALVILISIQDIQRLITGG
jgi:regulator of sigma E protease